MMEAIEFESKTDGGIIQLPGEYRQWAGKTVRVIVLEAKAAKTLKSRRSPHPAIVGKGKTIGDHLNSGGKI